MDCPLRACARAGTGCRSYRRVSSPLTDGHDIGTWSMRGGARADGALRGWGSTRCRRLRGDLRLCCRELSHTTPAFGTTTFARESNGSILDTSERQYDHDASTPSHGLRHPVSFTIRRAVSRVDLPGIVPKTLHGHLPPASHDFPSAYDLVVFSTPKRVRGGLARRALRALGAPSRDRSVGLLAVATGSLTVEASALLSAAGAYIIANQGMIWTDAQDEAISTLIRAKVKMPDHR